ncbi:MAG TPA: FAD:protein FMN transferase, partial [Pirellulales bacterium]|nr:FAD:protein FMN transferase [Pirellulales bacterium]
MRIPPRNLAGPWRLRHSLASVAALAALAGSSFAGLAAEPELFRFQYEQVHMGQVVKLLLYAADEPSANLAADGAYARIAQIDGIMSDYKPESELSLLSQSAGIGRALPLSDELWFVLDRAQRLAADSGGAFDVTVGPYVRLWRRARRTREFPTADRLAEARAAVGYKHLRLDAEKKTAELLAAGMRLDLGGIAAGYAADEALTVLTAQGITRAMIDASGDIVVGDPPPGAEGWRIGIAPLTDPKGPPSRFLLLKSASVTTSGDAFQHVEIGGKRYSHIVDPHTGLGLTDQSSVTVVARDGTTADSLATAVSVLGPMRGLELIERTAGAAALIVR